MKPKIKRTPYNPDRTQRILDIIVFLVLMITLSPSFFYATGFSASNLIIVATVFIGSFFCFFVQPRPKILKFTGIAAGVCLLLFIILLFTSKAVYKVFYDVLVAQLSTIDFFVFNWNIDNPITRVILTIAITVLIVVLFFIIIYIVRLPVITYISCAGLILFEYSSVLMKEESGLYYIINMSIMLIVLLYYYLSHQYSLFKSRKHSEKIPLIKWQGYNIAFAILILIPTLLMIPKGDVNLQNGRFNDFINRTFNITPLLDRKLYGNSTVDLNKLGLVNERKILGGPVEFDYNIVLHAFTDKDIYLSARRYDIYTGEAWKMTSETQYDWGENIKRQEATLSLSESLPYEYRMNEYSSELNSIFELSDIKIVNMADKFSSVLTEKFLTNINVFKRGKTRLTYDIFGCFTEHSKLIPGDVYTQNYLHLKRGEAELEDALSKGIAYKYKGIYKITTKKPPREYTEVSPTVTRRVKELARNITKNKKGDYEKAKAVAEYLKSNYRYTLTPETPPEFYDFVDYFLFEAKEGYCEYFATAMTVMCRSVGIPARYVIGYKVFTNYDKTKSIPVTGASAHSWTEIYIAGLGWIEVDAVASEHLISNIEGVTAEPIDAEYQEVEQPIEIIEVVEEDIYREKWEPKQTFEETVKAIISTALKVFVAVSLVIALILLAFTLRILYVKKQIKRLLSYTGSDRMKSYYAELLWLLSKHGFRPRKSETVNKFLARAEKQIDDKIKSDAKRKNSDEKGITYAEQAALIYKTDIDRYIEIFEEAVYSENLLDEEKTLYLSNYLKKLRAVTFYFLGKLRFILEYSVRLPEPDEQ